jgi:hypothetical protein
MNDKTSELMASREQLLQQMPDPSSILPGSLLRRMVRCDKAGCPCCENGKGKGHGPIWILSVRLGGGRLRQILIPAELRPEVEEAQQTFVQMKKVLNQIAHVNLDLLAERKRRSRRGPAGSARRRT